MSWPSLSDRVARSDCSARISSVFDQLAFGIGQRTVAEIRHQGAVVRMVATISVTPDAASSFIARNQAGPTPTTLGRPDCSEPRPSSESRIASMGNGASVELAIVPGRAPTSCLARDTFGFPTLQLPETARRSPTRRRPDAALRDATTGERRAAASSPIHCGDMLGLRQQHPDRVRPPPSAWRTGGPARSRIPMSIKGAEIFGHLHALGAKR